MTEQPNASLSRHRWTNLGLMALVAGLAILMAWPLIYESLVGALGPKDIVLNEAYAAETTGQRFDHSRFDTLLKANVDGQGWVDYGSLHEKPAELDAYLGELAAADFGALGRDDKLALLINAYNAFTLRLMLDHWPIDSIKKIPEAERWDAARWTIGGLGAVSLQQLEDEYLRGRFREPRIHFAINCASIGCPPLSNEAYVGERIEAQLEAQAQKTHGSSRWSRVLEGGKHIELTQIYLWYKSDFMQIDERLVDYVARYVPAVKDRLAAGAMPRAVWIEYDWAHNGVTNRREN